MKNFFHVLFGGLGAVIFGVIIAYGASISVKLIVPYVKQIKTPSLSFNTPKLPHISIPHLSIPFFNSVASAIIAQPHDGTSISGIKRLVKYSANGEENLINTATQSLTVGSVKQVTALAYIVTNLKNDSVSITHNADQVLPIASLTKLVTAVIAKKYMNPDEKIVINKDVLSTYGNTAFLKLGETLRTEDLLYPLLIVSSNDSAEALAQNYGRTKFIDAMNDFVQSIGAYRTSFFDPSGLSEKNVSTATDVTLILNWVRKNYPDIIDITTLKSKTIRNHTWVNSIHFLSWSNYVGGKNGYTDEANRTGAALFTMGKAKDVYSVVILGSDSRDSDIIKLLGKIKE